MLELSLCSRRRPTRISARVMIPWGLGEIGVVSFFQLGKVCEWLRPASKSMIPREFGENGFVSLAWVCEGRGVACIGDEFLGPRREWVCFVFRVDAVWGRFWSALKSMIPLEFGVIGFVSLLLVCEGWGG